MANDSKNNLGEKQANPRFVGSASFFNRIFQLVVLIIIIGGLSGAGIYLYDYYTTRVQEVNERLNTKRTELDRKRADLEDVKQLRVDYQQLEGQARELFDALPDKAELPNLYLQLKGLADASGVTMQSFNVAETEAVEVGEDREISEITVNVNLIGTDYQLLKDYLSKVENSLRIIDVTSLNYDPREDIFSVILRTYYKQEG